MTTEFLARSSREWNCMTRRELRPEPLKRWLAIR